MNTASFNTDIEFNDTRPAIKVILESPFSKEIRILLKKGQIMKEHKAPYPIIVHILKGSIDFGVNGTTSTLVEGQIISLAAKVLHDLKAHENSIVRLTLLKSDSAERVKQVVDS
ncbi:MAG: cupin domain-containing protein [Saprospiraceae bacterium]|nr:cupin domain-containing protein [Saprospiraceae bacterium]